MNVELAKFLVLVEVFPFSIHLCYEPQTFPYLFDWVAFDQKLWGFLYKKYVEGQTNYQRDEAKYDKDCFPIFDDVEDKNAKDSSYAEDSLNEDCYFLSLPVLQDFRNEVQS